MLYLDLFKEIREDYESVKGKKMPFMTQMKLDNLEKAIAALELIYEKPFAFASLMKFYQNEEYGVWNNINPDVFTKEQFNLLRDVQKISQSRRK